MSETTVVYVPQEAKLNGDAPVIPEFQIRTNDTDRIEMITFDNWIGISEENPRSFKSVLVLLLWNPHKKEYYSQEEANNIVGRWTMKQVNKVATAVISALKEGAAPK